MKFLDEVKIFLKSGNGGPGAVSFRREANVPYGGPDGGDGGKGADIIVECVEGLNTLIDFRYKQHFKAKTGHSGAGRNKTGQNGQPTIIKLPLGTQILSEDKEILLADLVRIGQKEVLLEGGKGGKGNAWFKSSTRQSPRISQPGIPGEEQWVWFRLKLIADVGLVGLPNAGKSTLLSVVSAARPKIASYPFTTLYPGLGVAEINDHEFIIADIPRLIKGALTGSGLETRFLGHIERCKVLLHMIDCCDEDPVKSWKIIQKEIKEYGADLKEKECITVLTKTDALLDELNDEIEHNLKKAGVTEVIRISSITGKGLKSLLGKVSKIIVNYDKSETNISHVH